MSHTRIELIEDSVRFVLFVLEVWIFSEYIQLQAYMYICNSLHIAIVNHQESRYLELHCCYFRSYYINTSCY